MLKIVHCFTDDKFISCGINMFNFINDRCENRYVHITDKSFYSFLTEKNASYLSKFDNIKYLHSGKFLSYIENEKIDVVILHNLYSLPLSLIEKIPKHIKVVWLAWGYDIYSSIGLHPLIKLPVVYHPETEKIINGITKDRVKNGLKYLLRLRKEFNLKKAVSRIDYFSGIVPEEYELMKSCKYFRAERIDFRYLTPKRNTETPVFETIPDRGLDIMVGHSGAETNNHADIFKILEKYDLQKRKIIVPLSYAGSSSYRRKIKDLGNSIWGDNFVPIESFLPLDEYKKMLSSCGFRIFGNERQQAMGNIGIALRDGCKVFLSESSVAFLHYRNLGLRTYTIQHDLTEEGLSSFDDDGIINERKRIVFDRYDNSKQIERLYKFIEVLS